MCVVDNIDILPSMSGDIGEIGNLNNHRLTINLEIEVHPFVVMCVSDYCYELQHKVQNPATATFGEI